MEKKTLKIIPKHKFRICSIKKESPFTWFRPDQNISADNWGIPATIYDFCTNSQLQPHQNSPHPPKRWYLRCYKTNVRNPATIFRCCITFEGKVSFASRAESDTDLTTSSVSTTMKSQLPTHEVRTRDECESDSVTFKESWVVAHVKNKWAFAIFDLLSVTSYFVLLVFVHWPLNMKTADLMRWDDCWGKNNLMLFFMNPLVQNPAEIYKTQSS